jgi:CRP/FNR family transcriptional regulator, cyclic AMP receptor protein
MTRGARLASLGATDLAFARSRVFADADPSIVKRCQILFRKEAFRRGTRIFGQDDHSQSVYIVASGFVRLSYLLDDGREMSVALVGAGELIGEEALLRADCRSFGATVVENCIVYRAPGEELAALFNRNAALAMNLARHVNQRYGEIGSVLEDLAQGRVRDRLLRALRRLASQCGEPSSTGQRLAVKLTHHEIATFVASTRETVTVGLAELSRAGAISRSPGSFTISIAPASQFAGTTLK